MFYNINQRRHGTSSKGSTDRSQVVQDQKAVYYDTDADENYVLLSEEPRGAIISLVIFDNQEDLVVDGLTNRIGKKLIFLTNQNLDLQGREAEIKYIVG